MTDVDRYRKHIFELAHRHHLCVTENSQQAVDDAGASVTYTVVMIPPIIDDTSYAVALHEMGHIVAKDGHSGWRPRRRLTAAELVATAEHTMLDRLTEERAAWEWAESVAIEWTAGMTQVRQYSEGTYYRSYQHTKEVLAEHAQILHVIEAMPAPMREKFMKMLYDIDDEPNLWHHIQL